MVFLINSHNDVVTGLNFGSAYPLHSKANVPTLDGREGKYSIYCRHQAKSIGSSCSKVPNSPMAFREGLLKATFGMRGGGSMTFF